MKLRRVWKGSWRGRKSSAFGVLCDDSFRVAFTCVEGNPIPAGVYSVERGEHPEHGECFEVLGVPGRTGILMHAGNTPDDSDGCIILGSGFDSTGQAPIAIDSLDAMARFNRFTRNVGRFTLAIFDPST